MRRKSALPAPPSSASLDQAFEGVLRDWDRASSIECECDHGDDEAYAACGRRARWRVTIDCTCGEDHPRTVELLCTRCLRTAREELGHESVTARPL